MLKVLKYSMAAVTAGLGFSFITQAADQPARTEVRHEERPLALPAGFQQKDLKSDDGIRDGLVKLTERAITKGDFNSFLGELSKPDRDRVREWKGADQGKLDMQIDRIRQAWKTKYGQDFDLKDKKAVFDPRMFPMVHGEVTDPAQALNNWPVQAFWTDHAITASGQQPGGKDNVNIDTKKNDVKHESRAEKLDKGRDVALVRFPHSHGMSAITVSMVHHLPGFWRVDIPNDRSGEMIYNDLLTHLTSMADHTDQWPSDVSDAYRSVAHHAVAALYGAPMMEHRTGG